MWWDLCPAKELRMLSFPTSFVLCCKRADINLFNPLSVFRINPVGPLRFSWSGLCGLKTSCTKSDWPYPLRFLERDFWRAPTLFPNQILVVKWSLKLPHNIRSTEVKLWWKQGLEQVENAARQNSYFLVNFCLLKLCYVGLQLRFPAFLRGT